MMDELKAVLLGLVALVGIFVLGFIFTGYDYNSFKFWAPKYANAQRNVFEHTQSYVEGKVEYLCHLRFQYQESSDTNQRAALRTLILSEASTIDNSLLPIDLQVFIRSLQ
jgi:hypothetical protein